MTFPPFEPAGATVWVILYDASFVKVEIAARVISASTQEAVNQVGRFSFSVPALDIDDDLYAYGRVCGLFHWRHGELLRGRILKATLGDLDDTPVYTVECASLAVELVWQDSYYGIGADNESAAAVLTKIIDDAEQPWTTVVTGGAFVNITNAFAPGTTWNTLLALAEMEDAYIRETATPRQLELSQNTAFSNIRLVRPPTNAQPPWREPYFQDGGTPLVQDGIIAGITAQFDGTPIVNRLVPLGLNSGDVVLDLGLSDRASPYTRLNLLADTPRVVNFATFAEAYNQSATSERTLEVSCTGQNRAIYLVEVVSIPVGVVLPFRPTIDGKEGTILESLNTGGTNHFLFTVYQWLAPRPGTNAIRLRYSSGGTAQIRVVAVAVSGVRQNTNPVRDSAAAFLAAPGSTTATVNVTSAALDLVLGFLMWTNGVPTEGAGQVTIGGIGGALVAAQASKEIAVGALTTTSATFGVAQEWAIAGVALMPALVWYIEDAPSIAANGRRTARFQMNGARFVGATAAEKLRAANTLYDRAVTRLERSLGGVTAYDVEVVDLPDVAWLVGDSMRLRYQGVESGSGEYIHVDQDLIVLERQRDIDAEGVIRWRLRLAPVYKQPRTIAELLYDSTTRVEELETAI